MDTEKVYTETGFYIFYEKRKYISGYMAEWEINSLPFRNDYNIKYNDDLALRRITGLEFSGRRKK